MSESMEGIGRAFDGKKFWHVRKKAFGKFVAESINMIEGIVGSLTSDSPCRFKANNWIVGAKGFDKNIVCIGGIEC